MKKWLMKIKREDGFTLLEMTIVLVVIAILMIVLLPNITNVNTSVTNSTNKSLVQTIEAQKLLYEAEKGEKPTLKQLQEGEYITKEQLDAFNEIPPAEPDGEGGN